MDTQTSSFRRDIEQIVGRVPIGCVTTYGDLAAVAGQPRAARAVGGIAHYGDSELPWHRVVNRFGGLASGYPGGRDAHAAHLAYEGVGSTDHIVDNFDTIRWQPIL